MTWYEKALAKSEWINGCLIFNGSKDGWGYGKIGYLNKVYSVHRLSYERSKGEIPEGLLVRHTCDNPSCWNPEHLILGTHNDNMKDMVDRGRSTKGKVFNSGVLNGNVKLTDSQVKEIKELLSKGSTGRNLANKYSLSEAQISRIKNRKQRNLTIKEHKDGLE